MLRDVISSLIEQSLISLQLCSLFWTRMFIFYVQMLRLFLIIKNL